MAIEGVGGIQSLTAGEMKDQFLHLFVTQMRNQNPLDPMSNEETLAQLAQFTQVEQLTELNENFARVLQSSQISDASALLFRKVSFNDEGTGELVSIIPEKVEIRDGEPYLVAGNRSVAMSDIVQVEAF